MFIAGMAKRSNKPASEISNALDWAVQEAIADSRRVAKSLALPESVESGRLVVADINRIQGLSGTLLDPSVQFLLPDMSALELAGMFDSTAARGKLSADQRISKFARVVEQNKDRIWIGRYWDELSRAQWSPRVAIRRPHAVFPELTLAVRTTSTSPNEWVDLAHDIRGTDAFAKWERERTAFLESARRMAAEAMARPELRAASDRPTSDRGGWLRRSQALREHVGRVNERYLESDWQELLKRNPDACAAARWMLIHLWVLLDVAIDPGISDRKLAGLWDDINYAFLASYSGHLWTEDKKLKQLVTELFPTVNFFAQ